MDDDLQQLEMELTRLRPASVPPRLQAQLARELAAESARSRSFAQLWWGVVLPAAAALTIVASQPGRRALPPPAATFAPTVAAQQLKPVTAENVLYAAADEGLVTLADGTPARRERLQFVDTIKWQDPRGHASLTLSVPREEVRVVPVTFQ